MDPVKQMIRELATYALTKPGAEQHLSWSLHDPLEEPHIEVIRASEGDFFEVEEHNGQLMARIPVLDEEWKRLSAEYPSLVPSRWMEQGGQTFMYVPLGADIPASKIQEWIDVAHALVWQKLEKRDRELIELAGLPYDEAKLLDHLIEMHNLDSQRKLILGLLKPAILLRTLPGSEDDIPLGATKIGGNPDLPATTAWPAYKDGKPLGFLAQLDLAAIAKLGTPVPALPTEGLLSIFSAWGWRVNGYPKLPESDFSQEEDGWTVVIHTASRVNLVRRETPDEISAFPAAGIELIPVLSSPNHPDEPEVSKLDLGEETWSKIDDLFSDYRSIQMGHYLKQTDSLASHHLLGGYPIFQRAFPDYILDLNVAMFLQFGSDSKTDMMWGDGGALVLCGDTKALAEGRFERIWCECQ
jgi:uncharacterized protein YwqG/predicted DNA-binding protein (MmcQ/YjbR family)